MSDKRPTVTVADLMAPDPTTLPPRATLQRAERELRLGRIRHLPIVDGDGQLAGIITERDVLGASDLSQPVERAMRTDVLTVHPDVPAYEAAYVLLRHAIGSLPVIDGRGKLVGILTDTDFVRAAYQLLGGKVPVDQIEAEEREADLV